MNGAQLVIKTIRDRGIDTVFGYPGGTIMPVYDALIGSGLKHVLTRHEQAAVHAAEGFAQARGAVGVCLVTSGPGLTNAITGLADALLDSVPIVVISGQVPTAAIGTDAFQEVDAFGLTLSVVKHSVALRSADEVAAGLDLAFEVAASGRPGPVHVDLPKDLALAQCPEAPRSTQRSSTALRPEDLPGSEPADLDAAVRLIEQSHKPVVLAGGGLWISRAIQPFRCLAEHLGAPVVSTLKGLGALPTDHHLNLGMLGMHGSAIANQAVSEADLLIVVGARLDDRATGQLEQLCPSARLIHLDIDPAEIDKLRTAEVSITGCLSSTLPALNRAAADLGPEDRMWVSFPDETRPAWPYESPCPRHVLQSLEADIVTTDVGQNQMWTAQHLRLNGSTRMIGSGGLGTMGFGLPAAIGAQLARPEARVVAVVGDGGLMMTVHELATLSRYQLPITVVLFDNSCLGMVRQWQQVFHDNRESQIDLSDNPDFVALAEVFGIPGARVERDADVASALARAAKAEGPFLLHLLIQREANVWPLVPPGCGLNEMLTEESQ